MSEASTCVRSFLLYHSASVRCARYLPVSPLSFCECSPHTLASHASITPHTPRSQKVVVVFLPSDLHVVQCVRGGLHVYRLTTMFIRPDVALRLCITTISRHVRVCVLHRSIRNVCGVKDFSRLCGTHPAHIYSVNSWTCFTLAPNKPCGFCGR